MKGEQERVGLRKYKDLGMWEYLCPVNSVVMALFTCLLSCFNLSFVLTSCFVSWDHVLMSGCVSWDLILSLCFVS